MRSSIKKERNIIVWTFLNKLYFRHFKIRHSFRRPLRTSVVTEFPSAPASPSSWSSPTLMSARWPTKKRRFLGPSKKVSSLWLSDQTFGKLFKKILKENLSSRLFLKILQECCDHNSFILIRQWVVLLIWLNRHISRYIWLKFRVLNHSSSFFA